MSHDRLASLAGAAAVGQGRKAAVEALDLDDRTVVLSISEKAMQYLPASVFKDPVVGAKPLEEALLAFAEHVRDNGFDHGSPYAAAVELLRARPPHRVVGVGEELRGANEDAGQALVRLSSELDGGVLPVQGPPGAGKTTQGANAILALAAAGTRQISRVGLAYREAGSVRQMIFGKAKRYALIKPYDLLYIVQQTNELLTNVSQSKSPGKLP